MAMFLTFWQFGTLSFTEIFPDVVHYSGPDSLIWWITGFMLLGVTGKSAQIPLYVWLPDAMAGPTPVSALIHAATMVTSGVYLITRSAPIFNAVEGVHVMVALVGAATAFFAATIAVGQYDIKKVLAFSTVSQLGFMVAAVGMGAYVAGMFHLVTHAFFKALLFLGSGSVILAVERGHHPLVETGDAAESHGHDAHHGEHAEDAHHEPFDPQDMRNMGGLRKQLPWTFWTYIMGTLALSGIPIWAGFWSKDEICWMPNTLKAPSPYTCCWWLPLPLPLSTWGGKSGWYSSANPARKQLARPKKAPGRWLCRWLCWLCLPLWAVSSIGRLKAVYPPTASVIGWRTR